MCKDPDSGKWSFPTSGQEIPQAVEQCWRPPSLCLFRYLFLSVSLLLSKKNERMATRSSRAVVQVPSPSCNSNRNNIYIKIVFVRAGSGTTNWAWELPSSSPAPHLQGVGEVMRKLHKWWNHAASICLLLSLFSFQFPPFQLKNSRCIHLIITFDINKTIQNYGGNLSKKKTSKTVLC